VNKTPGPQEPPAVREHRPPRDGAVEAALVLFLLLILAGILLSANRASLPPVWGSVAPWMTVLGVAGFLWWCGASLVLFLQHHLGLAKALPADFRWLRLWNVATPHDGFKRLSEAISKNISEKENRIVSLQASHDRYVGTNMSDRARRMASQDELGGAKRRVFVMFSDIRGFTRMTEQLKPEEVVEILNTCFTEFEKIIREGGGEINKYIGDAAFAYFRMPHGDVETGVRAVLRAAIKMQERFEFHNARFKVAYSKAVEIGLGVGVTAGEAILGNIGSVSRMEFTLIGDVVNMASRLCGIAKHGQILVSEEMAEIAKPFFELAPQPEVQLKGKRVPHRPFLVVGEKMGYGRDV
jgi:class 3 adenylate cyclase